ncbi:RodZ family helix-turn-helix domain-containing protein [Geomicrobium sp. JCM 19037]|uniref:helix-turn-helix domain-containing protein n=1 Tax=Geomicrobium sp. JCM 19037 TaxID=1460634 RepID=UPI0006947FBB|nr:helix-turn-helix domain-containing protein [Geomicrobium sp. JCM 19037]
MTELGQFLKEKREEFGWDLEEVQARTKIQKRYLQAIEEGNYSDLPGAFYARAFIKSYSEVLGLEPDQVFQQFESDLPKPKQEAVDLPSRTEHTRAKRTSEREKKSSILPAILIGLFLVVLVAGIWAISVWPSASDDEEENGDSDEQMAIVDTPQDEEDDEDVEGTDEDEGTDEENGADENGDTELRPMKTTKKLLQQA